MGNVERVMCFLFTAVLILMQITCQKDVIFKCKNEDCSEPILTLKAPLKHVVGKQWQIPVDKSDQIKVLGIADDHDQYYVEANEKQGYLPKTLFKHANIPSKGTFLEVKQSIITTIIEKKEKLGKNYSDNHPVLDIESVNETREEEIFENKTDDSLNSLENFQNNVNSNETKDGPGLPSDLENSIDTVNSERVENLSNIDYENNISGTNTLATEKELSDQKNNSEIENLTASVTVNGNIASATEDSYSSNLGRKKDEQNVKSNANEVISGESNKSLLPTNVSGVYQNKSDENVSENKANNYTEENNITNNQDSDISGLNKEVSNITNESSTSSVTPVVNSKSNESEGNNNTLASEHPYLSNTSQEGNVKNVKSNRKEVISGKSNESLLPANVSENKANNYTEENNITNNQDSDISGLNKEVSNNNNESFTSSATPVVNSKSNESEGDNNAVASEHPHFSNLGRAENEKNLESNPDEAIPTAVSGVDRERNKSDAKLSDSKANNHAKEKNLIIKRDDTTESHERFLNTKSEGIVETSQSNSISNIKNESQASMATPEVDSKSNESNGINASVSKDPLSSNSEDDNITNKRDEPGQNKRISNNTNESIGTDNTSIFKNPNSRNSGEKENENDEKVEIKSENKDHIKSNLDDVMKPDNDTLEPISNEEIEDIKKFGLKEELNNTTNLLLAAKSEVNDNVTASDTKQSSRSETSEFPEILETVTKTQSSTPSIAEVPKLSQQLPVPPLPPNLKKFNLKNIPPKKESALPQPTPNIDENENEIKVEIDNKSELDNKKGDSFEQPKTSLETEPHFKNVENEQVAGKLFSDNQENEKASYEIVLAYLPDLSFIHFDSIVFYDLIEKVKNVFDFDNTSKGTTENESENEFCSEQFCGTEHLNNFMESNHAVYIVDKKTVLPYWGETIASKEQIVWTSGLVSVSFFVLILVLVIVNNSKKNNRNKLLITKINGLENKLLVATKEIIILQEQVNNNEFQVKEKQNAAEIKKIAEAYERKMNQYKKKSTELEDKVSYLEKELENVSTSALEMHKLLENSLATQAQSKSTIDENFVLRSLTETQEAQIEDLRRENNALVTENQCLKEDNDMIKTSLKKIEKDYNAQIKRNLEITKKNRDLTLQLDKEIENSSALENNYKSRIYQLRAKLEDAEMNFKRSEFQVQELNRAFLDRQEGKAPEEVQVLCDDMQLKIQVSTLEAMNVELSSQLKDEKNARRMLEDHVGDVIKELNNLKKTYEISEKERSEAVTKLQVLTDYFKDKETQLHKELESKEKLNSERESKDQMLSQKLASMREEINNLRIQNDELKKEILDQESSYKIQLANAEQKTREHWFALRQSERKYKESQQEAASLRNRILLIETNLSSVSQKTEDKNNSGINEDLPSMIYHSPLSSDLIPYPSSSEFIPPPPSPIADHSSDFFPPEPIYSPDERLPPLGGRRAPSPPTGMMPDEDEFSVPPPSLMMHSGRNREPPTSSYNRRTPPPSSRRRPQFKSRVPRSFIDSPSSGMSIESLDKSGR